MEEEEFSSCVQAGELSKADRGTTEVPQTPSSLSRFVTDALSVGSDLSNNTDVWKIKKKDLRL